MSKILATPAARVAAKEKNIDLSTVKGTGKLGAIVLKDLDNVAVLIGKDRGLKVTPVAKNAMNYYGVNLDDVAHDGNKVKKENVISTVTRMSKDEVEAAPVTGRLQTPDHQRCAIHRRRPD